VYIKRDLYFGSKYNSLTSSEMTQSRDLDFRA